MSTNGSLPFLGPKDVTPCAVDPDGFFQVDDDGLTPYEKGQRALKARRICHDCRFMDACLDYALNHPYLDGVWGGETENGRDVMRIGMRKQGWEASHPTIWWKNWGGVDWVDALRHQQNVESLSRIFWRDNGERQSELASTRNRDNGDFA